MILSVVLTINILGVCILYKAFHKLIKITDKLYMALTDKTVDENNIKNKK